MAGKRNEQNLDLAGIPESPVLRRQVEETPNRVLSLHVGGVLIADLPLAAQGAILYQQTDEAMAERNARDNVRESSGITLGADQFTKACEKRKDSIVQQGMEPWEAANPMADLEKAHVRPGFKGKFLSPGKIDKSGMRGYVPVHDAEGKPVMLRNMILGEMPLEKVAQRNKYFQDKAAAAAGQVKQQFMKDAGESAVSAEK